MISKYDIARVFFFFFGFPRNGFGSIDVTNRCNLRCTHCYYFEQDIPPELSIKQWITKLDEIKRSMPLWKFPFFNCSWVGGEPLLRKDLIEKGKKYFRYNTVVTNGTIPLPEWPDVNWYISIDGDKETHEMLRNKKGCYERAMKHVNQAKNMGVTIAYCISKNNVHCIEQVLHDWRQAGAKHITFDFYTPVIGTPEDKLWIDFHERDEILERLIQLKRTYGDFIVAPESVFHLMKSSRCLDVTSHCLLHSRSFSFDASGLSKGKCVMGEKADCDRCGCIVPFYLRSITDRPMILNDLKNKYL